MAGPSESELLSLSLSLGGSLPTLLFCPPSACLPPLPGGFFSSPSLSVSLSLGGNIPTVLDCPEVCMRMCMCVPGEVAFILNCLHQI